MIPLFPPPWVPIPEGLPSWYYKGLLIVLLVQVCLLIAIAIDLIAGVDVLWWFWP